MDYRFSSLTEEDKRKYALSLGLSQEKVSAIIDDAEALGVLSDHYVHANFGNELPPAKYGRDGNPVMLVNIVDEIANDILGTRGVRK